MLTWIDQYIKQMGESHKTEVMTIHTGERIENPVAREFQRMTDFEAVKANLDDMMDNRPFIWSMMQQRERDAGTSFMLAGLEQGEAVYPMLLTDTRKLALQVDGGLLEDFWGALAPDSVDYWALLDKYDVVYIDLPPEALMVSDGLFIRAIVLYRYKPLFPGDDARWRVFCALPIKGAKRHLDNQIEIGWNLGEEVKPEEDFKFQPKNESYDTERYDGLSMGEPIRASEFREEVEELIKLILLYFESGEGSRAKLPAVTPEALAKLSSPKKQRAKHQQASLFSVVQLKSPSGRFGRVDQEKSPEGGWRLGVRTTVRGHFRWQAHGPKHTLRRLTWIAAFERGPKDAPAKTKMHVLKKETQP